MGHIQRHHLSDALVIVSPSDLLLTNMDKIMNPLIEKIIINNLETQTLTNIRDTLLPKLMSGEIRVKEAERMIEEVI
jgi:type I restriction enzyme S subunit